MGSAVTGRCEKPLQAEKQSPGSLSGSKLIQPHHCPSLNLFSLLLVLLVACAGNGTELPTRAVAAKLFPDDGAPSDLSAVPATWTPVSQPTRAAVQQARPKGATPLPLEQAFIPTNTPIPPTATPTPPPVDTPTATPYVSVIPNLPPTGELGPSKLGVHVIRNDTPAIMQFVRAAQPAVMKAVGDVGFLEVVKADSPRTITVGRIGIEHQSYAGDPAEAARRLIAEQLPQYQANPFVDYWEGWNEPDPNMDRMSWFARFEQERVRELARYGFRAAIGGFPSGVPELDEFMFFLPAIETAIEHRGIMTLHEGAAPTLNYLYGDPLPGYPTYDDRGSMSFRYRWYYREILEPAGLVIPLVISELTVDGMIGMNRPGPSGLGWQDFSRYWTELGTWGSSGEEAYIRQLAWYDAGLRQDGYVIGFTIFTAGGGDRWTSYEINGILPQLAQYVISQR
jgi:hypothetical protein